MKLKVGDRVKILPTSEYWVDNDNANPKNVEGIIYEIENHDCVPIDVKWDNGTKNNYDEKDLELVKPINTDNKMTKQQLMKDIVLSTANRLLAANNTVTNLEIKVELIRTDPEFFWTQASISGIMDNLAQTGTFTYTDNGTYRTYSNPNFTPVAPIAAPVTVTTATIVSQPVIKKVVKRISKTKALDLMKNSKGHFFTAVFVKKDGMERVINCQYLKDQDISSLGLIKVKETGKLKLNENPIRQINLQTLKQLSVGGQVYKIRK